MVSEINLQVFCGSYLLEALGKARKVSSEVTGSRNLDTDRLGNAHAGVAQPKAIL